MLVLPAFALEIASGMPFDEPLSDGLLDCCWEARRGENIDETTAVEGRRIVDAEAS